MRKTLTVILILTAAAFSATAANAEVWPRDSAWAFLYRPDGLKLTRWDTYGWSMYDEGYVLSRTGIQRMPQGLPYPKRSVMFLPSNQGKYFCVGCSYDGGYPFRRDWRLDANDSSSWLLGQLKQVCEVEQFTDFEPRVLEPTCNFNKWFR